jgi:SAM-dependent methyltransferase
MNRQAFTFTHNRDGKKLRLPERMLLAVCRPVEAPSLSVPTVNYSVENSLDFVKKMIPRFLPRIQGKTVLDYGCGPGWQAVAMRLAGARRVHGVDINDQWLAHGRDLAARAGVDGVTFAQAADAEKYDVVISLCGMEHYRDPGKELARMCSFTREELLITFAEPWYSPHGTHLNGTTRLPWLNLWFSERTLINVRNLYPDGRDGAKRFEDILGGLNKMTVGRFEKLVVAAPGMRIEKLTLHSVKHLPVVTRVPVLRELMTGALTCILKPANQAFQTDRLHSNDAGHQLAN